VACQLLLRHPMVVFAAIEGQLATPVGLLHFPAAQTSIATAPKRLAAPWAFVAAIRLLAAAAVGAKGFEAVAIAISQVTAMTGGGMTAITTMTVGFVLVHWQAPEQLYLEHQQHIAGDAYHAIYYHMGLVIAHVDVGPGEEEELQKNLFIYLALAKPRSPWTVCTFCVIPEQGKCVKIFLFVPMCSTK
jgi:hypothetical protein